MFLVNSLPHWRQSRKHTIHFIGPGIECGFQRKRRRKEKTKTIETIDWLNTSRAHAAAAATATNKYIILWLVEQVFEQNVSFSCELIQIELFVFVCLRSHLLHTCDVCWCEREVKHWAACQTNEKKRKENEFGLLVRRGVVAHKNCNYCLM